MKNNFIHQMKDADKLNFEFRINRKVILHQIFIKCDVIFVFGCTKLILFIWTEGRNYSLDCNNPK